MSHAGLEKNDNTYVLSFLSPKISGDVSIITNLETYFGTDIRNHSYYQASYRSYAPSITSNNYMLQTALGHIQTSKITTRYLLSSSNTPDMH